MTTSTDDSDIRAALAVEATDVMTVEQLLHRVRVGVATDRGAGASPTRLRRVALPLAAAAAVLAVATPAAVRVLSTRGDTTVSSSRTASVLPVSAGAAPRLTTSVKLPPTLQVSASMVNTTMQVIFIDPAQGVGDNDFSGTAVTTYQRKAFDQTAFLATAAPATAAGRTAHFGKYATLSGNHVYLLAWPISGQRWISVEVSPEDNTGNPLSAARSLAAARVIAATVDATAIPYSITSALRVDRVPTGQRIVGVSSAYPTGEQSWACTFMFTTPPGRAADQLLITAEPEATGPSSITVHPNIAPINGHAAQYVGATPGRPGTVQLELRFGTNVVIVNGPYSRSQLATIAAGITLTAHPGDPDTWPPSSK